MAIILENKHITSVKQTQDGGWMDGLGCYKNNEHFIIRNCIIDLSNIDVDEMDETLDVTWGASAEVENCVFRGAGKLVLIGSGDENKIPVETGKEVCFKNCIFDNFSRRGPEVQDGMKVFLENCLIQNWGYGDRFLVRSFASWAHTEDSYIHAKNCIYKQKKFFNGHFLKDFIGHFGQAWNDDKVKGIFSKAAWQPGVCKGLVATHGGEVEAEHCYKNHWWISIENNDDPMDKDEAEKLENELLQMEQNLYKIIKPAECIVFY